MTDIQDASPDSEDKAGGLSSRLKLALFVFAAACLLALVWWAYSYFTHGRYQESTNNAYIQADFVPIAPKVTGYVREIMVEDNQRVTKGQPLARIDASDYEAAVDRSRADVAAAGAQISAARAALGEQNSQIKQAQAQLAAAHVALKYSKGTVARYSALSDIGAETREAYDNAKYDLDRIKAEITVRKTAIQVVSERTPTLKGQLAIAMAQRDAAQAQLTQAADTLDNTLIRSDTAGIVGSKTARVGQFVQPGQRLMTIVPSNDLYVIANFKETQLALMREGQPVEITIDALDGASIKGEVQSLAPATGAEFSLIKPENATGNFTKIVQRLPVRIRILAGPTAHKFLRAGLSVTASVDTKNGRDDLADIEQESRELAAKRGQ